MTIGVKYLYVVSRFVGVRKFITAFDDLLLSWFRLLISFSGALQKMFRTCVIFGETMANHISMERL